MLSAFCNINKEIKSERAGKIVADTIKNELFKSYCSRRIIQLYKSTLLIQKYWKRFAPVLRARIAVLEKFLKKLYDQARIHAQPKKETTTGKRRRKSSIKDADDIEIGKKRELAIQLIEFFKRLEENQ